MQGIIKPQISAQDSLWVFGYGSLIWRPNFSFEERLVGYVEGFKRRFWQGSQYHRGTKERPGRVVTLVEKLNSQVWGIAYRIEGPENIKKALGHLTKREQTLGGYRTEIVNFYPKETGQGKIVISVLVYYADPENPYFLGGASYDDISNDILLSFGVRGSNIEYLLRLAEFMRKEVVGEKDNHLFAIEKTVRMKLNLCTKNTVSWLELLKNAQFLCTLRNLNQDTSEHILCV